MKKLTPDVKRIIDQLCGPEVTVAEIVPSAGVPDYVIRKYLVRYNKPYKKISYDKTIDIKIKNLHDQGYPYNIIAEALNVSLDKVYRHGNAMGLKNHKSDREALEALKKEKLPEPQIVLASTLSVEELSIQPLLTLKRLARYTDDQLLLEKLLLVKQDFSLEIAHNPNSSEEVLLKLLKSDKAPYESKVLANTKLGLREEAENSLLAGKTKDKAKTDKEKEQEEEDW